MSILDSKLSANTVWAKRVSSHFLTTDPFSLILEKPNQLMKIRQFYILIFLLGFSLSGNAQTNLPSNQTLFKKDIVTTPPNQPVRLMAEWEELEAIAVTYDLRFSEAKKKLIASIIQHAKEEVQVYIYCGGQSFRPSGRVRLELESRGIDSVNLQFFDSNFDQRIWIRDFGPQTAYLNTVNQRVLLDWIYEDDFPKADREVSKSLGSFYQTDVYSTMVRPYDFKFDGGNLQTDGMGMAITSSHIFEDNPHDDSTIDWIANEFMGVEEFIKLKKLPHDGIHHVDMHIKMIDEETLLIGEFPFGKGDYQQLETNINFLTENFKTSFGTDFKIHRIPMPADLNGQYPDETGDCSELGTGCYYTYTNALFVNKLILVPTYFGNNATDQAALQIWRDLMPGYKIIGIDCSEIIQEYGAIHCVTKEIGVERPLRIVHKKIEKACPDETEYLISTKVDHLSGIESVSVFYTDDSSFEELELTQNSEGDWEGAIPAFAENTEVRYYIEATANNGKTIARPIVGEKGAWQFKVDCGLTSSNNISRKGGISISPNPATDLVNIESNISRKGNLKIINQLGQVVKSQKVSLPNQLNISHLENGIYKVVLESERGMFYQRLVKTAN